MLRPPLYRLYSLLRFMCTARKRYPGTIGRPTRAARRPRPFVVRRAGSTRFGKVDVADVLGPKFRVRLVAIRLPRTDGARSGREEVLDGVAAFEDEPVHRRYAMVSVSLRTAGSTYVCSASCVAAASSPSGRIPPPHSPGGIAHSTPIHTDSERTPTESPSASPIEHQSRRRT